MKGCVSSFSLLLAHCCSLLLSHCRRLLPCHTRTSKQSSQCCGLALWPLRCCKALQEPPPFAPDCLSLRPPPQRLPNVPQQAQQPQRPDQFWHGTLLWRHPAHPGQLAPPDIPLTLVAHHSRPVPGCLGKPPALPRELVVISERSAADAMGLLKNIKCRRGKVGFWVRASEWVLACGRGGSEALHRGALRCPPCLPSIALPCHATPPTAALPPAFLPTQAHWWLMSAAAGGALVDVAQGQVAYCRMDLGGRALEDQMAGWQAAAESKGWLIGLVVSRAGVGWGGMRGGRPLGREAGAGLKAPLGGTCARGTEQQCRSGVACKAACPSALAQLQAACCCPTAATHRGCRTAGLKSHTHKGWGI